MTTRVVQGMVMNVLLNGVICQREVDYISESKCEKTGREVYTKVPVTHEGEALIYKEGSSIPHIITTHLKRVNMT